MPGKSARILGMLDGLPIFMKSNAPLKDNLEGVVFVRPSR
jgi:hypothetical protein